MIAHSAKFFRVIAVVLSLICFCGLSASGQTPTSTQTGLHGPNSPYFPYVQGWLGADDAYSVPLGNGKILWLFGDTFVAMPPALKRDASLGFIRNSIAISSCASQSCTFAYYWPGKTTPHPDSMFVAPGKDWYWPLDGFVYQGTLYIALMQMHAEGSGAFGFAFSGVQLASIANYQADPSKWTIRYQDLNRGGNAVPGVTIVVNHGPQGNPDPKNPKGADFVYFFTLVQDGVPGPLHTGLLRLPLSELKGAARPANKKWEYFRSDSSWAAWPEADSSLPKDHAAVSPGATEMTVRYHDSTKQWLAVLPAAFGSEAVYSLSPSMTGPWSEAKTLYPYPEMRAGNPNYSNGVFCYAAKEHVELEQPGQIFFTYACNTKDVADVTKNTDLYYPVVVTRPLPTR